LLLRKIRINQSFNPRAHEGRDRDGNIKGSLAHVSTHAPTKGATLQTSLTQSIFGFNPRAHEGRDQNDIIKYFNISFNPRAHEGRDLSDKHQGATN